jgi:muconolactone D-isomerase
VSLYRAADATQLHELIGSLPLFPWLEVSVEALATHPLEG